MLLIGTQYVPSSNAIVIGANSTDLSNSSTLALGLSSPNMPRVAGTSTVETFNFALIGYTLFIITALVITMYFLMGKKATVINEPISK